MIALMMTETLLVTSGCYCQHVPTCVSCNLWSKSTTTRIGSRTRRTSAAILYLSRLNGFYFSKTIIEMLRLCPNDNMGQRFWLGSLLIRCGRHADALYFAQQWLSDEVRKSGKTLALGGCAFSAPQNELPDSPLDETSLRWASGQLLYTAALASFKLFGDIPISQTYLKMAATCNPHVLLKILAQVRKPRGFFAVVLIEALIFARLVSEPQQRSPNNEWT